MNSHTSGRRAARLALAALALGCVVWPATALASAGHVARVGAVHANSTTYTDPTGDATNNAPDVTTVTVSNDDNGQITFAITLANRTALTANQDLGIVQLDTDSNLADGLGGADYVVGFASGVTALFNTSSGTLSPAFPASFSGSFSNGVETFSVNTADIGNPTQINFVVSTSGDGGATTGDRAPDTYVWNYQILITPKGSTGPTGPTGATGPTGPSGPPPVKLVETKPVLSKAVGGKTVTASVVVTNNGTVVDGSVTCSAKVSGKTLARAKHSISAGGKATCSWKLPKSAHGKTLSGTIGESYQGKSIKRSFSTKVK